MRISVRAKPAAREEKVEKIDESNFNVSVKEPPVQGRANFAIVKALAAYFGVSNFQVKLVSGFASKNKVFDIQK